MSTGRDNPTYAPPQNLLLRPVDALIPGAERLEQDLLRKRRLLVSFTGVICVFGYFFGWESYKSQGLVILGVVLLFGGATVGALNLLTLRREAWAGVAPWVLVGVMMTVMGSLPLLDGTYLWNSSLWWDVPIPLVAAFLLSSRVAAVCCALLGAEIVWLFAITGEPKLGPDSGWFRMLASVTVLMTVTVLAWLHERARQAGEERVRETLADLRNANHRLERITHELEAARDAVERDNASKTEFLSRMRRTAREQGASLDETSAAMAQMAATFRTIGDSVETLASSAEDSGSAATQIHAQAESAVERVASLVASVEEASASLQAMSFSVQEVAENVDNLSSVAEQTSSAMSEMNASIAQVESNARTTEELAETVLADAERGAAAVVHTRDGIENILSTSRAAGSTIRALSARVQAIDSILDVISDVAEQTQLLSLNAAIIATQAGHHGRGFGVVASEIKKLAERTGKSTKEIAALVAAVQDEASRAVGAIQDGESAVADGLGRSEEAERALSQIVGSTHETTRMVKSISLATREQSRGANEVAQAMERLAVAVSEIAAATAEQARGADVLLDSTNQMQQLAREVDEASRDQRDGGRRIEVAVDAVNRMVQQLQHAQREQQRGSELVLTSVESIHQAQLEQIESIEGLDKSRLEER